MRAHVKNVFSAIYVLHACYMRAACVHIRGTHAARMWTHVIICIILKVQLTNLIEVVGCGAALLVLDAKREWVEL